MPSGSENFLKFPPLSQFPWLIHGFIPRIQGVPVDVEKEEALKRLSPVHQEILSQHFQVDPQKLARAEQVHGNRIQIVRSSSLDPGTLIKGVDGLITAEAEVPLGIYVADCCAVYVVDIEKNIIGLFHSGKKGTELEITNQGIFIMKNELGANPANMIAVLSPCIHACCYEVNFVAEIEKQLKKSGVGQILISDACTACNLSQYYSYRKEKGKTGRMLAFMMLKGF